MIKIIDGKRYNTGTATQIAEFQNTWNTTDFYWYCETLYITKKGNWFLHGEGGPASKYAKSTRSQSTGSEEIVPFTPDQAYEWLESVNAVEAIEKYFSENLEDA